jgi:hypothetical protein
VLSDAQVALKDPRPGAGTIVARETLPSHPSELARVLVKPSQVILSLIFISEALYVLE